MGIKALAILFCCRWVHSFVFETNGYRLPNLFSSTTTTDEWIHKAFQETPQLTGVVGPKHAIIYDTTLRGTLHFN